MATTRTVSMSDVDGEVKVKKKALRKISAPPWLKGRLKVVKSTKLDKAGVSVPCCGVSVDGEGSTTLDERQFEDKSVQCDDLLPDNGHPAYGLHGNRSDRCVSCCHPVNAIYQTNVIVNQIPMMDAEPDDVSLPTFRRSHHPIRHRRNSQPLFRKNNLFATASLQNEALPDAALCHSSAIQPYDNEQQDYNGSLTHSEVSIPNSVEYDPSAVVSSKPRVPLRRRTGAYGNVTLNVQIANGINTTIMEMDEKGKPLPVPRRRFGVAPDRDVVRDSCRDSQSSCLVLGMNSDARNPLNYKMYTPFYNKRQTMPPEHFKNWPSESVYGDETDHSYRTLSYYSEEANQLEQYERRSFDAGSSCMLNAIDSNSIMYRSSMDSLPTDTAPPDHRKSSRIEESCSTGRQTPTNRHRFGAELRAKNKPSDQTPAQTQSNLLAPPTSTFGRWSGSIQNLFSIGSRTSNGSGRWSKSENCLNEVGKQSRQRNGASKATGEQRLLWSDRLFGRSTATGRAGKHGRARRTNTFLTSGGGSFFTYKYDDEGESAWQKYFSLGMLRKIRPKQGKPTKGKDGRSASSNSVAEEIVAPVFKRAAMRFESRSGRSPSYAGLTIMFRVSPALYVIDF
uniref:Uncharacterized protein n=1 Tax=Anopheles culicifacies TaxID=139723 RepID=A0A182M9P7_9DIPT